MALGQTISTVYRSATEPVVVALATAWIGIGAARPATTAKGVPVSIPLETDNDLIAATLAPDRFDYNELWSLQIGDYFMPLSQTFTLRAKKKLNVSSLVDGVDIIQQTRKAAKTIDCVLRISLREGQQNLKLLEKSPGQTEAEAQVVELAQFLRGFYDSDAILAIRNAMINDTFGVQYVIISEYKFTPREGQKTYLFEFSLTEVQYGDNVLTLDLRQIRDTEEGQANGDEL